jgi:hypothetical protein
MAKKTDKKAKKDEEEEHSGGASLDDAFADDEDVEYAPSKPTKIKKKKKDLDEEMDDVEEEVEEISKAISGGNDEPPKIKASKPISKVKKGDRINIDGKEYIVDSHYVLIDHKTTKEMAIELYDKEDNDYQIRYFDDQMESTLQFYELQEIMFIRKGMKSIEW